MEKAIKYKTLSVRAQMFCRQVAASGKIPYAKKAKHGHLILEDSSEGYPVVGVPGQVKTLLTLTENAQIALEEARKYFPSTDDDFIIERALMSYVAEWQFGQIKNQRRKSDESNN